MITIPEQLLAYRFRDWKAAATEAAAEEIANSSPERWAIERHGERLYREACQAWADQHGITLTEFNELARYVRADTHMDRRQKEALSAKLAGLRKRTKATH